MTDEKLDSLNKLIPNSFILIENASLLLFYLLIIFYFISVIILLLIGEYDDNLTYLGEYSLLT
jgi:hypothetical protein